LIADLTGYMLQYLVIPRGTVKSYVLMGMMSSGNAPVNTQQVHAIKIPLLSNPAGMKVLMIVTTGNDIAGQRCGIVYASGNCIKTRFNGCG
jgi:hypothetical protein